ncbi:MFS transporter [Actinomyces vulturis]|uniref:MFS transporter n=1 Tax=Actinomyces vulturis TaxID=1857645 RepID=UPI0008356F8F|nr:MFS transporter [Actinomyces vulturis]
MTPQHTASRPSRDVRARQAAISVAVLFLMHGIVMGTWFARIPSVRGMLSLDASGIAGVLLVGSLGTLSSMPVSGAIAQWLGLSKALILSATWYCVCMVGLCLATIGGYTILVMALLCVAQMGSGVWSTCFNAASGPAEQAWGSSIIPRFHAMWSLGTVIAAFFTSLIVSHDVSFLIHMSVVCAVVLTSTCVATAWVLPVPRSTTPVTAAGAPSAGEAPTPEAPRAAAPQARQAWKERRTVGIGLLLLAFGFSEGAASGWIALGVTDDFGSHTNEALGAMALTIFTASMMVTRLAGTTLINRWGPTYTMRLGTITVCIGLILFSFSPWLWGALIGVSLWALGTALAYPLGMSAASDDAAWATVRVAVVATIAYGAALVGPPILGALATHVGYRHAQIVIAFLMIPAFFGAGVLTAPGEHQRLKS